MIISLIYAIKNNFDYNLSNKIGFNDQYLIFHFFFSVLRNIKEACSAIKLNLILLLYSQCKQLYPNCVYY